LRELQEQRALTRTRPSTKVREELESLRLAAREVSVRLQTARAVCRDGLRARRAAAELPEEAEESAWEERARAARRADRAARTDQPGVDRRVEGTDRAQGLPGCTAGRSERRAEHARECDPRSTAKPVPASRKPSIGSIGMQELFPRLFGGGHAYLELESDDLLEAGVTVMARPPGKRISTIQSHVRRRKGPDCRGARVRHFPAEPGALLHARRGGRAAG
jgi:chromosome segregation protein